MSEDYVSSSKETAHYVFDLLTTAAFVVTVFSVLWPSWLIIFMQYGYLQSDLGAVNSYWQACVYANIAAVVLQFMALWASGWNKSGSLVKFCLCLLALLLIGTPLTLMLSDPVIYSTRTTVTYFPCNSTDLATNVPRSIYS
jgi:hypothetical protein